MKTMGATAGTQLESENLYLSKTTGRAGQVSPSFPVFSKSITLRIRLDIRFAPSL